MKIAITASNSNNLEAPFNPRFGRAANFIIFDTVTGGEEACSNPAARANRGAGIQAAQFVADYGVQVVISGHFGPKADQALAAAGIEMFLAPAGEDFTVGELLALYQKGQLKSGK